MSKSLVSKFCPGCLSATWIKLIAVACMTLDHIGAYGYALPYVAYFDDTFRLIGRVAVPLFLYIAIESAKLTKNRGKFLLRLYIASVCVGAANLLVSRFVFGGGVSFGNIFQSFAWTVGLIYLAEMVIEGLRQRELRRTLVAVLLGVLIIGASLALEQLFLNDSLSARIFHIEPAARNIFNVFLISPLRMEYSAIFLILGFTWYFMRTKLHRCWVLLLLSVACFLPGLIELPFLDILSGNQWAMALAIPFILLYNGKYGRGFKYFFYIYYPLHAYLIFLINVLYAKQ